MLFAMGASVVPAQANEGFLTGATTDELTTGTTIGASTPMDAAAFTNNDGPLLLTKQAMTGL